MKVSLLNQIYITQNSQSSLKNGAIVNGRVISFNGGKSYTVSLAGNLLNVSSNVKLEQGQLFKARLNVSDSKIFLQLVNEANQTNATKSFFPSDIENKNVPQSLENYLMNLGLPLEGDSLRLLQFLRENNIKFDFSMIKKAFSKNKKNESLKNDKIQIAILMEEKGLDSSQIVNGVIYNQQNSSNEDEKDYSKEDENENLNLKDYISSIEYACQNNKIGPLTFFNTLSEGENQWILLPFEWSFKDTIGVIRVLYNKNRKETQKIVINFTFEFKNYIFALQLNNNHIKSLRFALEPALSLKNQNIFEQSLKQMLKNVNFQNDIDVQLVEYSQLEGFAPENSPLIIMREDA